MKAPDKIYIFLDGDESWYTEKDYISQPPTSVQYIRKDALIEWLERKMTKEEATEGFVGGYDFALKCVINKINSM